MDEPTNELHAGGISRRSALKRIGAGAAIAWTAPVLMSVGTKAFAASPVCNSANCFTCGGVASTCGSGCFCFQTDGPCTCAGNSTCESFGTCTTTGDCVTQNGAGFVCIVNTCCGQGVCAPVCGTDLSEAQAGVAAAAVGGKTPAG